MDIGFSALPTDYSMDIAKLAKRAEELGFESLWVPEHPVLPVDSKTQRPGYPPGPIPKWYADQADPFVSLARASAATTTLKLGTGVCIVPESPCPGSRDDGESLAELKRIAEKVLSYDDP